VSRSAVLRLGLAGAGTMGRHYLRLLAARDDVTLVALADPLSAAREAASAIAPRAAAFSDPLAMLDEEGLHALIVASPTTLHVPIALRAVERGIAVLVEKPIAGDVAQGRLLVAAAERAGVLLQVGHVERFNPAVLALGEQLRQQVLGPLYSVRTVRSGPQPERIRDVGVAVDLGTHDLDVMCRLLGERPLRVYAETRGLLTGHEDLLYGLLRCPSGVVGQLDVNWLTPDKQRRISVLGAEGMLEVDYLRQTLTFTRGSAHVAPTYLGGFAPTFSPESIALAVHPAEPLERQLDAFISALRTGGPSPVTGEDGLWAVALADLLLTSAEEHRPLDVRPLEVP
jgi:predicted dehydrogenase